MFRKSVQRCMLRRARCQLAAATAPTTQRGILHKCSVKAGGIVNGRVFENQMLAASNSVHETYDVISLSSLKSQVKLGALDECRGAALVELSKEMKILKEAEKAKQGLEFEKDDTAKKEQTLEWSQKTTVDTVMQDVECDFVAVMKPAKLVDELRAMQDMNDFCRRTADEVAVLNLKPPVPNEKKQEQETPTLSKVVEDNFFVANERSVPTKVLMEVTVASTFFELQQQLYRLAKADAYLDCVEGEPDLPRRLLMVAINSNKDAAEEIINKLFEPDQAKFRELVRRALQPDVTEDDPVQVVVLWAPFRNIHDEMRNMNQKVDELHQKVDELHHSMDSCFDTINSRLDKMSKDTNKKLDDLSDKFDELKKLILGPKK